MSRLEKRIKAYLDSISLEDDSFQVEVKDSDIQYAMSNGSLEQIKALKQQGINVEGEFSSLNTYEDACKILGEKVDKQARVSDKIETFVKAANFLDNNNKVWKPVFDVNTYNYFPYFQKKGVSWVFLFSCYRYSRAFLPAGFYYKSQRTCTLMANKLLPLYIKWLNGKK